MWVQLLFPEACQKKACLAIYVPSSSTPCCAVASLLRWRRSGTRAHPKVAPIVHRRCSLTATATAAQVEPSDLTPLTFASHSYPTFHLLMPTYGELAGCALEGCPGCLAGGLQLGVHNAAATALAAAAHGGSMLAAPRIGSSQRLSSARNN